MVRRAWASRAERRDPSFKLASAVLAIDEPIMLAARGRVSSVLSAAGVREDSRKRPVDAAATEHESLFAKQTAAVDALTKKANDAAKQLAKQQELSRAAASGAQHSQGGGGGGPHKGGKGGDHDLTKRAAKSKKFWDNVEARKAAKQSDARKGKGGKW